MQRPYTSVIVLCAGSANRMGFDKIFAEADGEAVIGHTLTAFRNAETTDEIVVVCADVDRMKKYLETHPFAKVTSVVKGGSTRQNSVWAGLGAVSPESGFVSVHDGARPLITPTDIDTLHKEAYAKKAVLCGYTAADTVKITDGAGRVVSTPDRSRLFCAATPQVFERGILQKALETAREKGLDYTDDSACVEAAGYDVYTVPCSRDNFKLTTPEDFVRFKAVLRERNKT